MTRGDDIYPHTDNKGLLCSVEGLNRLNYRSTRSAITTSLTLNDAESEQVTVLQPQQVTHLDQQLLAQGLHLRERGGRSIILFTQTDVSHVVLHHKMSFSEPRWKI